MGTDSEALGAKAGASGHLCARVPRAGAPEHEGKSLTVPEMVQEPHRARGHL